ncbi:hypothetical protein RQP46_005788 [Phenoliferia psychrophenolica]
MRDKPCSVCLKRPSEVQGGGEFQVCGRCEFAIFCSVPCQKKAWPSHKAFCKMTATNRSEIEALALSRPLTTGLITSRSESLKTDIDDDRYYNTIQSVAFPPFDDRSDRPELSLVRDALLQPDEGWFEELRTNLERPSNDFQKMHLDHVQRRVDAHRSRLCRTLIDEATEAMAHVGDQHDTISDQDDTISIIRLPALSLMRTGTKQWLPTPAAPASVLTSKVVALLRFAPPRLPPELVAEILKLTIESLFEEERHLVSHVALTNHFLISASVVNRTWHTMVKDYWFTHALVFPRTFAKFILFARAHRMTRHLERVRLGGGGPGSAPRWTLFKDDHIQDKALRWILIVFRNLRSLELVGEVTFKVPLNNRTHHRIEHLTLSSWSMAYFPSIIRKFQRSLLPPHLSINLTRPMDPFAASDILEREIYRTLTEITSLEVICRHFALANSLFPLSFLSETTTSGHRFPQESQLESIHLECLDTEVGLNRVTDPYFIPRTLNPTSASPFANLTTLTAHLAIAHYLAIHCDLPALSVITLLPGGDLITGSHQSRAMLDLVHLRWPVAPTPSG